MSDTLHKREMSARVAGLLGCPKYGGELALNAVMLCITDAVRNGDRVVLTPTEYDLLATLSMEAGQTVPHERLGCGVREGRGAYGCCAPP